MLTNSAVAKSIGGRDSLAEGEKRREKKKSSKSERNERAGRKREVTELSRRPNGSRGEEKKKDNFDAGLDG
jgi:hypothetical protein